jgi:hypothetical protein
MDMNLSAASLNFFGRYSPPPFTKNSRASNIGVDLTGSLFHIVYSQEAQRVQYVLQVS